MTTHPNDLLECPLCGADVKRQQASIPIQVGARSIPVEGDYSLCTGCGEVFFGPGEMDRAMRTASSVVRNDEGLLHSEEIRAIREGLDLSQAQFERLLGVGPKTVVRWEKGTVFQNGATDTLLRLIRDVPACVEYLGARRGLSLRVSAGVVRAPQSITVEEIPIAATRARSTDPIWPLMRKHRVSTAPRADSSVKLHRGTAA